MTCGESEADCIIGTFGLIKPSVCKLEIVERYADQQKVTRYFFGQLDRDIGSALTERKKNGGTEPVWFPVRAAHELFSKHQPFAGSDER